MYVSVGIGLDFYITRWYWDDETGTIASFPIFNSEIQKVVKMEGFYNLFIGKTGLELIRGF